MFHGRCFAGSFQVGYGLPKLVPPGAPPPGGARGVARRACPAGMPPAPGRWGPLAKAIGPISHGGAISFGAMPLISVVIPVHGVEDYLDRCLDSVLADPAASLEVIAVDDASPDSCGAILAARQDPRLRVLTTTT